MPGCVAVIHPYWDFWSSSVPWDLRSDREELLADAVTELAHYADVVRSALVSEPTDARRFVAGLDGIDAVVVVSSMAVPPATGMSVLDLLPDLPVVIWAVSRVGALPPGFSHSDITTAGSTVGAPMLASALARQGRPFDVVASTLEDPGGIGTAVQCATAAGRVRQARLLRIGEPISGYTTVVPPEGEGHGFHPTLVELPAEDLAGRTRDADSERVARTVADIEQTFTIAAGVDPVGLQRVAAAEVALREVLEEHGCSGGALNCHVAALRPHADFGIAPCLALGRLTSEGLPFTCTGDVLTALAMLAVQALDLPTLYHEIEALDHDRDEVILANTGEHDRRLCGDGRVDLIPNVWYEHDPITAPCAMFTIPPGPASLVGFVFAPTPRFVVAEGEFTGRRSPSTGTPHAGFRFHSGSVGEAWARWAATGVIHHSAATNAHVGHRIRVLAQHLGTEFVSV